VTVSSALPSTSRPTGRDRSTRSLLPTYATIVPEGEAPGIEAGVEWMHAVGRRVLSAVAAMVVIVHGTAVDQAVRSSGDAANETTVRVRPERQLREQRLPSRSNAIRRAKPIRAAWRARCLPSAAASAGLQPVSGHGGDQVGPHVHAPDQAMRLVRDEKGCRSVDGQPESEPIDESRASTPSAARRRADPCQRWW